MTSLREQLAEYIAELEPQALRAVLLGLVRQESLLDDATLQSLKHFVLAYQHKADADIEGPDATMALEDIMALQTVGLYPYDSRATEEDEVAFQECLSGGVDGEEVAEWLDGIGTDTEHPCPRP